MDGILRALGFESKPDYAEKIPQNLKSEDFFVHNTFHHGFPTESTCLEYDAVQQLLAIGTKHGAVLLMGKAGLERYFVHPTPSAVIKMQFITNMGLLVTCSEKGLLYLWSIKGQTPKVLHTFEFTRDKEKPTCLSYIYKSHWLYVGSENGNVYVIHIPDFTIATFVIYWNQALGLNSRVHPGHVLSVTENPMDQGKILIAYNGGYCVQYNMRHHDTNGQHSPNVDSRQPPENKVFSYDPGDNHVLTSVSWMNVGRCIACSYSDGSIVIWNTKSEAKPEKVFYLHINDDPSQFRPIYKMQVIQTDSDPMQICSGGFPENSEDAPRTITVVHGKSTTMLNCNSTIIDFLCLPSSPHNSDVQKPFALVILTKNEMVIHDLTSPGYPKYPSYSLPYALDIHVPAVSFIYYSACCPEEFIAQLHSVKSKMMTTSAKAWPLNGGKWGQELPHSTSDIIITGHTDGSVRLWHCNSVVFQPFFTIDTSRYFKTSYDESPAKQANPGSAKKNRASPVRPPPPSHPPPRSSRASKSSQSVSDAEGEEVGEDTIVKEEAEVTPSPATGQIHSAETPFPGQEESTDADDRQRDDKKIRKKKKSRILNLDVLRPLAEEKEEEKEEDQGDKKVSNFSFRKMANKAAKMGRTMHGGRKHKHEEVDGEDSTSRERSEDKSGQQEPPPSSTLPLEVEQNSRKKRPPPRPSTITLTNQDSKLGQLPPDPTKMATTPSRSSSSDDDFVHVDSQEATTPLKPSYDAMRKSPRAPKRAPPLPKVEEDIPPHRSRNSPHRLTTRSRSSRVSFYPDDDFFVVNFIDSCLCGLWLCVVNNGGNVMAFDFSMTPKTRPAKCLEVNFNYDSVKKQYTSHSDTRSGTPLSGSSPTLKPVVSPSYSTPMYTYDEKINDSSAGYQLHQLCQCFYTVTQGDNDPSPSTPVFKIGGEHVQEKVPVAINKIRYSTAIGLLVIGTRRGFAMVDTRNNSCLYILTSSTSMLYLSDPSKFTTQMKRESKLNLTSAPSIRRHGTSIRFSDTPKAPTSVGTPGSRTASVPHFNLHSDEKCDKGTFDVSVELESCVSSLELVQLQLDKNSTPMLTLWVGLASGYVAAYGVNVMRGVAKRIELIPTRFITETKGPVVNIMFLNEWGDLQVVPYKPNRALSMGDGQLEHALQHRSKAPVGSSNAPYHYAIFVDEFRISSFSFPGFNKISNTSLPIKEDKVILRSEYFTSKDLPCLVSLTSCQAIFVHSLPGIKLMLYVPFSPLGDPRVMSTFRVSGNGQGLYMSSASEIQRISIVKEDMLNFPDCLPAMYTEREDVSPSSHGKGFLGALFFGSPSTVDKDELFGEAGGHIGNICKVDGKSYVPKGNGKSTLHKQPPLQDKGPTTSESRLRSTRRSRSGYSRTGTGISGQIHDNRMALDERTEKLCEMEKTTRKVQDNAKEFNNLTEQLLNKYKQK